MPKKKVHIEGRTQEERIEQRKQLGSLRSLTVQPAMKKRYDEALSKFFDFLRFEGLALPKQKYHMDTLAAEYIEDVWSSGEGGALASDTGAGLQNLEPHLKGRLPTVWRWLKVWSQNELPNRAPPMPESVVHAIAGRVIFQGDSEFALSILLGLYGMMRTGELSTLSPKHVEVSNVQSPAALSLELTKSGK